MAPRVEFKPLHGSDGSAAYHDQLYSILASVNGPIEVQRRDELPEEAAIEVNVRPLSGIGGPRERWLEGLVQSVLRDVILVHLDPRTLMQITLQIVKEPATKFTRGRGDIAVIPSLINASFVGLLDAGLPLRTTAISALVVVDQKDDIVCEPTAKELATSRSTHALAYDKDGKVLLAESIGKIEVKSWTQVATTAEQHCLGAVRTSKMDDEDAMDESDITTVPWLRTAFEEKVRQTSAWREST